MLKKIVFGILFLLIASAIAFTWSSDPEIDEIIKKVAGSLALCLVACLVYYISTLSEDEAEEALDVIFPDNCPK